MNLTIGRGKVLFPFNRGRNWGSETKLLLYVSYRTSQASNSEVFNASTLWLSSLSHSFSGQIAGDAPHPTSSGKNKDGPLVPPLPPQSSWKCPHWWGQGDDSMGLTFSIDLCWDKARTQRHNAHLKFLLLFSSSGLFCHATYFLGPHKFFRGNMRLQRRETKIKPWDSTTP